MTIGTLLFVGKAYWVEFRPMSIGGHKILAAHNPMFQMPETCDWCGEFFIPQWDEKLGDFETGCQNPECQAIDHAIDMYEAEQGRKHEERMFRWAYWGE